MVSGDVLGKRGQQMTLGTIIAIVLGIVILVFLIFGFSKGWGNMWDTVMNLGGGSSNVDDVIRGCDIACAGKNKYAFCSEKRTVKFGKAIEVDKIGDDGNVVKKDGEVVKDSVKSLDGNCSYIASNPGKFNGIVVAGCSGLC